MGQGTVDASAIAAAIHVAKRSVERRALKESWQFTEQAVRGGRRRLYVLNSLPRDVQAAVILAAQPSSATPAPAGVGAVAVAKPTRARIQAMWTRYEAVPKHLKATAQRRLKALQAVEALVRDGAKLLDARAAVAAQLQREGIPGSAPSLARWAAHCDGLHRSDWLAALVPEYVGRTARRAIDPEAWDLFKADYLRPEAPTAASCYARLARIGKVKGWTLPSLRTFERAIDRLPPAVRVLQRQGDDALQRMFPAQERDRTGFQAMEAVNSDGHRFDVFVRTHDGRVVRPILLGVQDLGFGKIVGWRIAETESTDLVRMAFHDAISRYGIPRAAYLDNGRAFASKLITGGTPTRFRFQVREDDPLGVLTQLGIEIHWTTPYHGQAKPIERAWRDMCDTIAKHPAFAGAYTGNKPDAKPENYASRAVPWDEFVKVVNAEIAAHNAREGRRARACAGRSFDQAFNESYAVATVRKATTEQLRQMLLPTEVVTGNQYDGSLRLAGNRYWHEALAQYRGRKVAMRFDPDALHASVQVYTLDGTWVCEAECVAAVGFADTNAAREYARARKQFKRAARLQRDAELRMDAAEVAAQLPEPIPTDLPPAGVVAPMFGKPTRAPAEAPAMARTGTDDTPAEFGDYLKAMQDRQIADTGWLSARDDD